MSDSKSKCRPFKNGGDCQKTEGSKMKKLRKNDLNVKNSKKSTEYACASVIKPTTSGKVCSDIAFPSIAFQTLNFMLHQWIMILFSFSAYKHSAINLFHRSLQQVQ